MHYTSEIVLSAITLATLVFYSQYFFGTYIYIYIYIYCVKLPYVFVFEYVSCEKHVVGSYFYHFTSFCILVSVCGLYKLFIVII